MSQERRPTLEGPIREAEAGLGGLAATGMFALVCESAEDSKPILGDEICGVGDNVGLSPVETYAVLGSIFVAFIVHGIGRMVIRSRRKNNQ